jgi:hypothetical protein
MYLRKQKKEADLTKDQKGASFEIADLMMNGKHIIYVDESTFHRWLIPSRSWVSKDMVVNIPSSRG